MRSALLQPLLLPILLRLVQHQPKIHHLFLGVVLDLETQVLRQLQHRPVVRQHIANHLHGAPRTAVIDHLLHQGDTQALAFHLVIHHHGELAAQVVGVGPGADGAQGFLTFPILPGRVGDEHHLPVVVDLHHLGHVFPGEVLAVLEEPVAD